MPRQSSGPSLLRQILTAEEERLPDDCLFTDTDKNIIKEFFGQDLLDAVNNLAKLFNWKRSRMPSWHTGESSGRSSHAPSPAGVRWGRSHAAVSEDIGELNIEDFPAYSPKRWDALTEQARQRSVAPISLNGSTSNHPFTFGQRSSAPSSMNRYPTQPLKLSWRQVPSPAKQIPQSPATVQDDDPDWPKSTGEWGAHRTVAENKSDPDLSSDTDRPSSDEDDRAKPLTVPLTVFTRSSRSRSPAVQSTSSNPSASEDKVKTSTLGDSDPEYKLFNRLIQKLKLTPERDSVVSVMTQQNAGSDVSVKKIASAALALHQALALASQDEIKKQKMYHVTGAIIGAIAASVPSAYAGFKIGALAGVAASGGVFSMPGAVAGSVVGALVGGGFGLWSGYKIGNKASHSSSEKRAIAYAKAYRCSTAIQKAIEKRVGMPLDGDKGYVNVYCKQYRRVLR